MSARRSLPRRLLTWAAVLCGAGAALVALQLAVAAVDRSDEFALPNAALADSDFLLRPLPRDVLLADDVLPVHAHRLAKGRGTVFGERLYSNGSVFAMDDETYDKLTVWIPHDAPVRPLSMHLGTADGAVAVFTKGGSAWPHVACAGVVHEGRLTVEPTQGLLGGTRWRVRVEGTLRLHEAGRDLSSCPKRLDRQFEGATLAFDDLTPWLGTAGEHPYRETYR